MRRGEGNMQANQRLNQALHSTARTDSLLSLHVGIFTIHLRGTATHKSRSNSVRNTEERRCTVHPKACRHLFVQRFFWNQACVLFTAITLFVFLGRLHYVACWNISVRMRIWLHSTTSVLAKYTQKVQDGTPGAPEHPILLLLILQCRLHDCTHIWPRLWTPSWV